MYTCMKQKKTMNIASTANHPFNIIVHVTAARFECRDGDTVGKALTMKTPTLIELMNQERIWDREC